MSKLMSKLNPAIKIQEPLIKEPLPRPESKKQPSPAKAPHSFFLHIVLFSLLILALAGLFMLYTGQQKTKTDLKEQSLQFAQFKEKAEEMTARIETALQIQNEKMRAEVQRLEKDAQGLEKRTSGEIQKLKNEIAAARKEIQTAGPDPLGLRGEV